MEEITEKESKDKGRSVKKMEPGMQGGTGEE